MSTNVTSFLPHDAATNNPMTGCSLLASLEHFLFARRGRVQDFGEGWIYARAARDL
jgi:hypothetical protein